MQLRRESALERPGTSEQSLAATQPKRPAGGKMLAKKWLALFALPLLAAMVLACGGGGKSGRSDQGIKIEEAKSGGGTLPTPGAPPPPPAAAPTAVGAPASADEVSSLAGNFGKVKSFKASIEQTGGATASLKGNIEYSQPDKIH